MLRADTAFRKLCRSGRRRWRVAVIWRTRTQPINWHFRGRVRDHGRPPLHPAISPRPGPIAHAGSHSRGGAPSTFGRQPTGLRDRRRARPTAAHRAGSRLPRTMVHRGGAGRAGVRRGTGAKPQPVRTARRRALRGSGRHNRMRARPFGGHGARTWKLLDRRLRRCVRLRVGRRRRRRATCRSPSDRPAGRRPIADATATYRGSGASRTPAMKGLR